MEPIKPCSTRARRCMSNLRFMRRDELALAFDGFAERLAGPRKPQSCPTLNAL